MRHADPGDLGLKPWLPPFLLGFLATACQAYLLREFGAEFYGNELTFGLFLGCWLLWGGIGSLVRPRRAAVPAGPGLAGLYGLVLVLFAVALAVLRFSHRLLGLLPAELTGLVPALGFAFLLGLLLNFPLGRGFTLNARLLGGDVPTVYILESAGAAAAGLIVSFGLVPRLSNWRGAAIVSAAAALVILSGMKPGRRRVFAVLALVLAAGLAAFDLRSQKAAWAPLRLVDSQDTPYGKLQVVRNEEQATFFDNGQAVFSHPDPGAAEEAVHFALLQRQGPRAVLLVGGGAGGGATEALKHAGVRVDCVELDPAVIRLAGKYLTGPDRAALDDPRVRIFIRDGRAFVAGPGDRYDAILLNLPEPATAQVNRYYTREFFAEARARLSPDGVLGFVVPSAENYISAPLGEFLSSIAATLRGVFPNVRAVPGEHCVFLASAGPLSLDPAALSASIERRGLDLRTLNPGSLAARLDPARVEYLARKLAGPGARINRDLVPASYYFHSILWASQFRGVESRILRAAAKVAPGWILDAPLALCAIGLAVLAALRRRSPARFLVPVAVMGFTTMAVELAVFVAFQARFGSVYGKVPLLLALFMAGVVLGAVAARARRRPGGFELAAVQGAFALLLLPTLRIIGGTGGQAGPFAVLFGFGGLGGYLFVASNRRLLVGTPHAGLAYGIDLLASFTGVVLASALIIPLYGIPALILRLAVLNGLSFLYVVFSPRR
ncbi:MAG TPA: methyltransferase [Candidatus Aminicenantes bacterium]|nr:methyltransferase [Candidatus Aminicenantes bacterium]HRY65358.1 methyltransferase [Candidatus Aminicenantes bacterium]HRZ72174.1 methyltransferase [Candidatus Aminicenantes bacterium]